MVRWLRLGFFALIVRPVLLLVLGVNIRNRERLPVNGPAIIVANHNSHLDTLALMSMLPLADLPKLTPVAAVDYFGQGAFGWFAKNIIGILPIDRSGNTPRENLLDGAIAALDEGKILILFPEGTRGEPERLATYKKGVAHLVSARPRVPVTPVFIHGLGKALPRGTYLLVPFTCDVFVGESWVFGGAVDGFMERLEDRMSALASEGQFPAWE
jgi:1-acyl-sn-glycerol-3-phosphate acyltransferase